MSLEDRLASLVDAITAHTDAIQHLAAALRMQSSPVVIVEPKQPALPTGDAKTEQASPPGEGKRGPGRPRKVTETPPPSPVASAANAASASGVSVQDTRKTGAPAGTATSASPSDGTYADLQELVPKLAAEQGRSAAVAIFTKLGFASGRELQEKDPDKIPKAVALFRAALGVQ